MQNVFAVHAFDESGKPALVRQEVTSSKLFELIANLPPYLIGIEAALAPTSGHVSSPGWLTPCA